MTSIWVGLDFGTSSAKAVALDDGGNVVRRAAVSYPTARDDQGRSEQEATTYIEAATSLLAEVGGEGQVKGIGLSGHTPSLVFVDDAGNPVRPVMTWQDTRAHEEAAELGASFGPPETLFGTVLPWAPANAPAKLAWVSRHEPDVVEATHWVLQPKDYVGLWLTGEASSDPWSSKGLCNVETFQPVKEVLGYTGWDSSVAPPLASAWSERGRLRDGLAGELGLSPDIPVTVGWSDALAGMLALGVFEEPRAFDHAGSSDIVGRSVDGDGEVIEGLMTIPTTCAPLTVVYGPTQSSGTALQWLASTLGVDVDRVIGFAGDAEGCSPPVFVPYLSGERAPIWRSDVAACFMGIRHSHGPEDLALSVMWGVSASVRHVLEVAEAGQPADTISLGGSVTQDPVSIRTRAAMLGRPVLVRPEQDISAVGAAMLAAAMTGIDIRSVAGLLAGDTRLHTATDKEKEAAQAYYHAYRRAVEGVLEWT